MTSPSSTEESAPSKSTLTISDLRNRVLIGPLPKNFLRLTQSTSTSSESNFTQNQQIAERQPDVQTPLSPTEQYYAFIPPNVRGRLVIKIVEAKLTKNYGFVRMDPYVRVRVGNLIFETPTSVNGGKTPTWNRTIHTYLPNEVDSINLQVYDERAFTNDECVAWAYVKLPDGIFSNEIIDEWYSLSGQQGEGKEGVINLIISFTPVSKPTPLPVLQQHEQTRVQQQIFESGAILFTEDEVKELSQMFPAIDEEVIRSVLEEKNGNKEETVTSLIEITS